MTPNVCGCRRRRSRVVEIPFGYVIRHLAVWVSTGLVKLIFNVVKSDELVEIRIEDAVVELAQQIECVLAEKYVVIAEAHLG
jgi:hypothetical protein